MNKKLIYVTGNNIKFTVALKTFEGTGIELIQRKLDTPEIQSNSVQEVAKYSASWACEKLKEPVIVTDAGFCIEALKGFPGPFIKYVNGWFTSEDFINLMKDKCNRNIAIEDCLAYCCPGEEPVVFTGSYKGRIAEEPSRNSGTPIDQVFIPEGFDVPISDIPPEEMISYWSKGDILSKFKEYMVKTK